MEKENRKTPTPKEAYCESRMYGPCEDGEAAKPTHVILSEMLQKKHDGLLEEIEEIKSQQVMFLGEIELLWESVRVLEGDLEAK